jgi:hypothetical protein
VGLCRGPVANRQILGHAVRVAAHMRSGPREETTPGMVGEEIDSAVVRRNTLANLVLEGATDGRAISQLVRNGVAITDEAVLWDFKLEVPIRVGNKTNPTLTAEHDFKMSEDC